MNLQAELAYVQARLGAMQRLPPLPGVHQSQSSSPTNQHSTSDLASSSNYNLSMQFDPLQPQPTSAELASYFNPVDDQDQLDDVDDVQALAREIISRYLPGVRFRASSPH